MWRLAKTFAVCQRTIEKSISRFVHKVNAEMSGKPDLYIDRRSPPVRSVLLLLEALKIEVNEKPIDLFKGEHLADDYLKVTPLHTVPSFKDESVTLTDSHAILIYLCEKHANDNCDLWPTDPIERINVLNKLFYSGTLLFRRDSDAIGSIIIKQLRKAEVEEHATRIREQYDILEKFFAQSRFVAGNNMTIADLSIVTIVSTVDMIVPVTIESWPKLHNWWHNHMKILPYYEKANQDGLIALKTLTQQCTDYPINFD